MRVKCSQVQVPKSDTEIRHWNQTLSARRCRPDCPEFDLLQLQVSDSEPSESLGAAKSLTMLVHRCLGFVDTVVIHRREAIRADVVDGEQRQRNQRCDY